MIDLPGYMLDCFALLFFLNDEPGANKVEQILNEAAQGKTQVWMNEINLGEVFYILLPQLGETPALEKLTLIRNLPISFDDNDWSLVEAAARLKAHFPVAFADCFAAASATLHSATVLTGDPEFKQLEGTISVEWFD